MPPLAIVAALSSALIHASWNAALKGGRDRVADAFLIAVGGILTWLVVAALSGAPRSEAWPYLAASVLIHLVYWFALFSAYDVGDTSPMPNAFIGGGISCAVSAAPIATSNGAQPRDSV